MKKPIDIAGYLAGLGAPQRKVLQRLRRTIRSIVPDAEECISYGIPAFRVDGRVVAGFLATKKGCSYFPFSGSTLAALKKEVAGFSQTKGALHFDPAKGLPVTLVRKLIKTRLAESRR